MAKKQDKKLWLWLLGTVIIGFLIGPTLGLFATYSVSTEPITVQGYKDYFGCMSDGDDKEICVINEGATDLTWENAFLAINIENNDDNINDYFICSEQNTNEYTLINNNKIYDVPSLEAEYGDDDLLIHCSKSESNILILFHKDTIPLMKEKYFDVFFIETNVEDTPDEKCLFNYGEDDKCFSILYGIFALVGTLLLIVIIKK